MPQPAVAFQRHAIFLAITGVATLDYVYIIFWYNQRPKLTRNWGKGIISHFFKIFGFAHLKPKQTFVLRHTCVLACRHTFDTVGSGTLLTMVRLKHVALWWKHVALFCGTLLTLLRGRTLCHRSGCTCPCGKRGGRSRPGRDKKEIFRQIIHWR